MISFNTIILQFPLDGLKEPDNNLGTAGVYAEIYK
jgi:hypothetical protein